MAPLVTIAIVTYCLATFTIPYPLTPQKLPLTSSESLALILGIVIAFISHELSHIAILAVHGIKATGFGVVIGSLIGGYVEATFPEEKLKEVKKPFYAAGIGINLIMGALFLTLSLAFKSSELALISAMNIWFVVMNSFLGGPFDANMLYEDYFAENPLLAKILRFIPVAIWILILVVQLVKTL